MLCTRLGWRRAVRGAARSAASRGAARRGAARSAARRGAPLLQPARQSRQRWICFIRSSLGRSIRASAAARIGAKPCTSAGVRPRRTGGAPASPRQPALWRVAASHQSPRGPSLGTGCSRRLPQPRCAASAGASASAGACTWRGHASGAARAWPLDPSSRRVVLGPAAADDDGKQGSEPSSGWVAGRL